ncbi:MAG TPA: hypothetical protein VGG72_05515 [Bryobacteraceae bacterium]|jgi:hypothetical protein
MSFTHEDFGRQVHGSGPSDRAFGLVFAAALLVFGLSPLRHENPIRIWCLASGVAVFLATVARPSLFHGLNLVWTKIGRFLGRIVNPIVTALLFFLVFTPGAILLRWLGRDLLDLALDPGAKTYWIQRAAPEASPGMKNQF